MAVAKKNTRAKKVSAAKAAQAKAVETKAVEAKAVEVKAAEAKATVSVQFGGKEYTTEALVQIAKDVWQYDLQRDPAEFKTVELYVKTEESAVYYVVNGEVSGSFAI